MMERQSHLPQALNEYGGVYNYEFSDSLIIRKQTYSCEVSVSTVSELPFEFTVRELPSIEFAVIVLPYFEVNRERSFV